MEDFKLTRELKSGGRCILLLNAHKTNIAGDEQLILLAVEEQRASAKNIQLVIELFF